MTYPVSGGSMTVAALINKWHTGGTVSVADVLFLTSVERKEFYSFLSPANEAELRGLVNKYLTHVGVSDQRGITK